MAIQIGKMIFPSRRNLQEGIAQHYYHMSMANNCFGRVSISRKIVSTRVVPWSSYLSDILYSISTKTWHHFHMLDFSKFSDRPNLLTPHFLSEQIFAQFPLERPRQKLFMKSLHIFFLPNVLYTLGKSTFCRWKGTIWKGKYSSNHPFFRGEPLICPGVGFFVEKQWLYYRCQHWWLVRVTNLDRQA